MNNFNKYKELFFSTFKLSACTFGGGFVIIPLMRKKCVEDLGWILVGYHIAGVPGAIITMFGTVLPPLIIISIISLFYQAFRDNAIVNIAMAGMLCGVAAVICDVVINMAKSIFQKKQVLPVLVMLGSFIAVRFFSVNIIIIIVVCGVIGAFDMSWQDRQVKVRDK